MAAKALILVIEEGSGRILAARVVPAHRAEHEFEQLTDHFQLGAAEEPLSLVAISQTLAIRLKRTTSPAKIRTDQDVIVPLFSSPPSLP